MVPYELLLNGSRSLAAFSEGRVAPLVAAVVMAKPGWRKVVGWVESSRPTTGRSRLPVGLEDSTHPTHACVSRNVNRSAADQRRRDLLHLPVAAHDAGQVVLDHLLALLAEV